MHLQENLRRATGELVILKLLLEEDLYGYQLIKRIKERSEGLYTLPEATLYPVIKRLASNGYISENILMVENRQRKYYRIGSEGRAYYDARLQEYDKIAQGIRMILNS